MEEEKTIEEQKVSNKRIGTFTFGLTMILFGISITIQTFMTIDVLKYLLMLWPLVFVSLGLEAIYYTYKKDIKIKYDIWGIILIFLILTIGGMFSMANYAVNKILYSDTVNQFITEKLDQVNLYETEGALQISNISQKQVNLKITEQEGLTNTRAKIYVKYKDLQSYIFANTFEEWQLETFNFENNELTITSMPDFINNITIVVTTPSKQAITQTGCTDITKI